MISKISLHNLLPSIFADSQAEPAIAGSQVWLKELSFDRGGHYLIEAESGAGKTSLCSYVYGCRTDYLGSIGFDGWDIRSLSIPQWCELRRKSLAFLPQELRLFPELTLMDNIRIKNQLTRFKTDKEIMEMLESLGIADKADVPAARLSVGQQQKGAIVRALCQPYDFLILDEPVSHLDARNNAAVARLITEEAGRQQAAILATSVGNKISIPVNETILL